MDGIEKYTSEKCNWHGTMQRIQLRASNKSGKKCNRPARENIGGKRF